MVGTNIILNAEPPLSRIITTTKKPQQPVILINKRKIAMEARFVTGNSVINPNRSITERRQRPDKQINTTQKTIEKPTAPNPVPEQVIQREPQSSASQIGTDRPKPQFTPKANSTKPIRRTVTPFIIERPIIKKPPSAIIAPTRIMRDNISRAAQERAKGDLPASQIGTPHSTTPITMSKQVDVPLKINSPALFKPLASQIGTGKARTANRTVSNPPTQALRHRVSSVKREASKQSENNKDKDKVSEDTLRFGRNTASGFYNSGRSSAQRFSNVRNKRANIRKIDIPVKDKKQIHAEMLTRRRNTARLLKNIQGIKQARNVNAAARTIGSGIGNVIKIIMPSRSTAIAAIAAIVLFITIFMSMFTSLGAFAGTSPSVTYGVYLADDSDINSAELYYTGLETDLRLVLNNLESNYPGYDRYRYRINGSIGHNPYTLMSMLTAVRGEFKFDDIRYFLDALFATQYQLNPTVNTVTPDPSDDDPEPAPYTEMILEITVTDLKDIAAMFMTGDQIEHYNILLETKGGRQYAASPIANTAWYVSSVFGWRIHPINGDKQFHTGVDIAVPEGTPVLAGHDGVVTTAAYDSGYGYYIIITDDNGLATLYAHCSSFNVIPGQEVKRGDVIALSGNSGSSTGPHLHYEVVKDGIRLNPLYFSLVE